MDTLFRLPPRLPAAAYRTYQVAAPIATHWRPASCAEVDCEDYLRGWTTVVDERVELGQRQANYIRHDRSRRSVEQRRPDGTTAFWFEAGQRCFGRQHRVRLDRPELYVARDGDWRGNPTGWVRRHTSAADWVEDFGEHQLRVAVQVRRG